MTDHPTNRRRWLRAALVLACLLAFVAAGSSWWPW